MDGDLADDPDAAVVLEVYDQHWIADTEVRLPPGLLLHCWRRRPGGIP